MTVAANDEMGPSRDEAAADWCVRLADAPLSADEIHEFDAWLRQDGNRDLLEDAVALWSGIDAIADAPEMVRIRTQALDSFASANARRWRRSERRPMWQPIAAITAMLILVLAGSLLVLRIEKPDTYATGIGERRIAMLADGSRVSLDAASTVQVRLRDGAREMVLLHGRAKFEVAKDPLRPFSVSVGDKLVVATGTSFSVEQLADDVRVMLYEGHVEVLTRPANGGKAVPIRLEPGGLQPGHELTVGRKNAQATIAPVDAARADAWGAGQLDFVDEPLSDAVERVNRYTRQPLTIADSEAGSMRVSGVYAAGDTAAFVEGVTAILPISATRTTTGITLQNREL